MHDETCIYFGRSIMASTSSQGFELNRSDRGWESETSNDHESLSGNNEMIVVSIEVPALDVEIQEPYIGMEFKSLDAARMFYEMYGKHVGFTVRNAHIRRSQKDNSIIGREFVCSKEGFRVKKNTDVEKKNIPQRKVTREGCNARMRVAKKEGEKWVVTGIVKEHSHDLDPSELPAEELQMNASNDEDEKNKKIRALLKELSHERKLHAACRKQLNMTLKYIDEHNQNLSSKVEVIFNKVKELESIDDTPHN